MESGRVTLGAGLGAEVIEGGGVLCEKHGMVMVKQIRERMTTESEDRGCVTETSRPPHYPPLFRLEQRETVFRESTSEKRVF
jgi:hypothetical protein